MKNKILLYDLENFPHVGEFWDGMYEQNILSVIEYGGIASIAWKFLGEKKVYAIAIPDYKGKDKEKQLLKEFHSVLNSSDILVGHNHESFDIKKLNAYFIRAGLSPIQPYKSVDTLKVAKKYFKFNSNKLDQLGDYLGIGRKVHTGGYSLWQGCKRGDKESWRLMVKYNKQDVILLEKVYNKFLPFIQNHPYIGQVGCENCGSHQLHVNKTRINKKGKYKQFQCIGCGHYQKGDYIK